MARLTSPSATVPLPSADTKAPTLLVPCASSSTTSTPHRQDPATVIEALLIPRVLGEFLEMPGLALTMDQAARLWGCDDTTCRRIADLLVERRMLRWSRDGRLMREG